MGRKIFRAVCQVSAAIFLASLVLIMGISYGYLTRIVRTQLKAETFLASQGVAQSGIAFLHGMDPEHERITWIAANGDVLYDSNAEKGLMENHTEREEVRAAFDSGYGESVRYSRTFADRQLYAAKRLPDGSVLRMSIVQRSVWTLLLDFAQPICAVMLLALVLSFVLALRLAKRIVAPINSIDPDDPLQYCDRDDYRELEPLLRRLACQKAQLRRDRAEIEKAALIRQEFTANVSHELKTPLHAISGYAELIENGMVREEDLKPFAGRIRQESARLSRLAGDVIELTKLDSESVRRTDETCDLHRIAENVLESMESSADARQVTLRLEGGSATVRGCPQLLHSVVFNLCDNALRYNRPRGTVTIRTEQDDRAARLSVRDTGIGIPKESQDRVYERFYRVDRSRSKDAGGTGLGLSIVKHAVLLHHGRIELNSIPGEGTIFTVTFPRQPQTEERER